MAFYQKIVLIICSWALVAYGQPATIWWCGLIASACGFALFWATTLDIERKSHRFWLSTLWFFAVQLVQLSWFVSHPYLYIYILYTLLSLAWGVQFGLVSLFVNRWTLQRFWILPGLAGAWTFMEMMRLFIFSGFTWNPVGLALTGSVYSLQSASLWGAFGLSFWVIWTNLLLLRAWVIRTKLAIALWIAAVAFPYAYGAYQLGIHSSAEKQNKDNTVSAVLVQTAFPIEEAMAFATAQDAIQFVMNEWTTIVTLLSEHKGKEVHLIVLPEYVVPYGTFYPVFPFDKVKELFTSLYGKESLRHLPLFEEHLAAQIPTEEGPVWMVNNAYWVQAIANVFNADVVVGLEDRDQISPKEFQCFSSAFLFAPRGEKIERYEKRILVPMGEYIPFAFCRAIAASYGINGSFTCGTQAKCLGCRKLPIGASICYEETYGHLMRDNRLIGVEMLVNLTNDGWYPHSTLPRQHMEHARLRTVEMGIPLIRSCNTGITGAIDCFGRTIATLYEEEEIPGTLFVKVPRYTYHTPYTIYGDWLVVAVSSLAILAAFCLSKRP